MSQNNFNSVRVRIEFDFTSVNDRIMAIEISDQDLLITPPPDSPGIRTIEFDLIIPSEIKMIFSGKNQDLDTILDGNNNIVQDLCVKFNKIWLDGIPVNVHPSKMVKFLPDSGESISTNYIGFNGELTIAIDQTNTFDQIMSWNRLNL
jgi:hypothetical protein